MKYLQEEKIKKIFKSKRLRAKDIMNKMFPQKIGAYYSEIRRMPLSIEFIEGIKNNFGIDILKELEEYEQEEKKPEGDLQAKYEKAIGDNVKLTDENLRLSRELIEMSKKLIDVLSKKE